MVDENGNQVGNVVVYEYIDPITGEIKQRSFTTDVSTKRHSERIGYETLANEGIPNENVTRIYFELEPCELPSGESCGEGCKQALQDRFSNAEVTHSYDYSGNDATTKPIRDQALKDRNTDFNNNNIDK